MLSQNQLCKIKDEDTFLFRSKFEKAPSSGTKCSRNVTVFAWPA